MNIVFWRVLLLAVGALVFTGCEGDDGKDGAAGAAGPGGGDGFSCWDLNQNGVADRATKTSWSIPSR